MWLPNWLYQIMPFIYMITSIIILLSAPSIFAALSGILFGWAGIWIFRLRY